MTHHVDDYLLTLLFIKTIGHKKYCQPLVFTFILSVITFKKLKGKIILFISLFIELYYIILCSYDDDTPTL
jgi:succinate-acetate transporter protein